MAAASSSNVRGLDETDDGWVLLPPVAAPNPRGKPPRPPPPRPRTTTPASSTSTASAHHQAFDPAPDDIVGRYLPLRRALRCDVLPRQIHDADVYGAHHPAFLAAVYPAANNDRFEWFFFACRGREHTGGRQRRAGPGAYRLASETKLPGLGGTAYCHAFRYYEDEDEAGSASETAKETEWRMDEYGDDHRGSAAGAAFDMVVCKVYPARGGAVHRSLQLASPSASRRDANNNKPQVLVQLYLDSLSLGDPRRCRMHAADDAFVRAAHPAVLTVPFPAANDRCEWFFAARRRRTRPADGDEEERPRRAGPGAYVPVRECRVAKSDKNGDVGYRRVFRYREDDPTLRRVSRTEWWMEEYGFGKDFPYGELPAATAPGAGDDEEELVVYKLYMKMAGDWA